LLAFHQRDSEQDAHLPKPAERSGKAAFFALCFFLIFSFVPLAASAKSAIPKSDGWVTDLGDFLTAEQERALEALMASYKAGSGNEIVLLTVPDLGGRSLENFALEVARSWGLGEKDRHNGALLLVARAERKVRIEVGRGLEGTLTDSIAGRIIRDVIAPEFRRGRIYDGLREGITAMHAAAGGDYAKIPKPRGRRSGGSGGLVLFLFFIFVLFSWLRRGGGGGGLLTGMFLGSMMSHSRHGTGTGGWGGGFGGFGGGGGFSGGGASGGW